MKYVAINKNEFNVGNYFIVPIRQDDMENIRKWRNAQMNVLRQPVKISQEDQVFYFETKIKPSFKDIETEQLLFSFLHKNLLIGYGGLVNLSWNDKRAEMSFLLDDKRAKNDILYKNDMTNFISLIKMVVFEELKFNRLFTETYDFRLKHISILEENGFIKEGELRKHIIDFGKSYNSIIHGILKSES